VFTPFSGMGLNLALQDGTAAARFMSEAVELGGRPATLDQYEHARRPDAEKLLESELAHA
jgi:2-polyprenyl-6-methoxyphenol hydroxylase-like FAD-dependent oxidoreductase